MSAPPPPELIAPLLVSLVLAVAGGVAFGKALVEWRQGRPAGAGWPSRLTGAVALGWSAVAAARLPGEYWRYPLAVSGIWVLAWILERLPRGSKDSGPGPLPGDS